MEKKKKEEPTVSKPKKKLDTLYSRHLRLSQADHQGYVTCYTCGLVRKWDKGMQCGHFHSRSNSATRYYKPNTKIQCMNCNVWRRGNYGEYSVRLVEEIGITRFKKLAEKARSTYQFTVPELQGLIEEYKEKLKKYE